MTIEVSSGIPFDNSAAHAASWVKQGYAVERPVKGHVLNEPCPVCSDEPVDA